MKARYSLLLLGQSLDALTFTLFMLIVPAGFAMAERNPITLWLLGAGALLGALGLV